ncbi:hypothetical protein HA466_0179200 [Hirschfeldia incana]|nr:hypothetical protein HA466_0179200 [Hirschfeldia incana]
MEVENDDAASEARQTNPPARQTNPETDAPSSSNGPRVSNASVSNAPRASTVPKPSRKRRSEQATNICNETTTLDTFALLTEDDDMDLMFEEEEIMYHMLEDVYGVTNLPPLPRQMVRTNRGGGWRCVQCLMFESDKQCFEILRMNQGNFMSLCSRLQQYYNLEQSCNIYHEESVAMFVEMVAQDLTVRALCERYQRSGDTVSRKLDEVLSVLLKLAADIIKPSRGEFTTPSPVLVNDSR